MASDLISRDALLDSLKEAYEELKKIYDALPYGNEKSIRNAQLSKFCETVLIVNNAPTVDAVPIGEVAEMLAELFGEECCCNYNGIDEWLPELCEHSDTCPEVIGKNGCWKQFIKHWKDGKKND